MSERCQGLLVAGKQTTAAAKCLQDRHGNWNWNIELCKVHHHDHHDHVYDPTMTKYQTQ